MVVIILFVLFAGLSVATIVTPWIFDLAKVLLVITFIHQMVTLYEVSLWGVLKKIAIMIKPQIYQLEDSDKKAFKKDL